MAFGENLFFMNIQNGHLVARAINLNIKSQAIMYHAKKLYLTDVNGTTVSVIDLGGYIGDC